MAIWLVLSHKKCNSSVQFSKDIGIISSIILTFANIEEGIIVRSILWACCYFIYLNFIYSFTGSLSIFRHFRKYKKDV